MWSTDWSVCNIGKLDELGEICMSRLRQQNTLSRLVVDRCCIDNTVCRSGTGAAFYAHLEHAVLAELSCQHHRRTPDYVFSAHDVEIWQTVIIESHTAWQI